MATPRKDPKDYVKTGRPTLYNQEIAKKICKLTATNTCGIKRLCDKYPELPHFDTINEWRWVYPEFSLQYADAKRSQMDLLVEETLEISDDLDNDVNRDRLRVDTRKWLASKLAPKIYGDAKIEIVNNQVAEEVVKHKKALDKKNKKEY